jgi:hypothetical protein
MVSRFVDRASHSFNRTTSAILASKRRIETDEVPYNLTLPVSGPVHPVPSSPGCDMS